MSLQSDIERIAQLRGKKADDYTARMNAPRPINAHLLANLFSGSGDISSEMRIFDRLPGASREFIRNSPVWISASVYRSLLAGAPSEGSMIRTMQGAIAEKLAHVDAHLHLVTKARRPPISGSG